MSNFLSVVKLEFINDKQVPAATSQQLAEAFGKQHAHVMRDIRETTAKCSKLFSASNFGLAEYLDGQGKSRPMYFMAKDGFTMVAMAYTTPEAVRFKEAYIAEFDRMEETLRQTASQQLFGITGMTAAIFNAAGIAGNQQALALDKIVRKKTGDSPLELAEVQLEAPTKRQLLTPTQLGEKCGGISGRQMNGLLANIGFQTKAPDGGWEPTEKGMPYAVMLDVNKRHSDGAPIRQLKWDSSILEALRKYLGDDTNGWPKKEEYTMMHFKKRKGCGK